MQKGTATKKQLKNGRLTAELISAAQSFLAKVISLFTDWLSAWEKILLEFCNFGITDVLVLFIIFVIYD